jgi:hypothetical protein
MRGEATPYLKNISVFRWYQSFHTIYYRCHFVSYLQQLCCSVEGARWPTSQLKAIKLFVLSFREYQSSHAIYYHCHLANCMYLQKQCCSVEDAGQITPQTKPIIFVTPTEVDRAPVTLISSSSFFSFRGGESRQRPSQAHALLHTLAAQESELLGHLAHVYDLFGGRKRLNPLCAATLSRSSEPGMRAKGADQIHFHAPGQPI